jgi:hypothetical protein
MAKGRPGLGGVFCIVSGLAETSNRQGAALRNQGHGSLDKAVASTSALATWWVSIRTYGFSSGRTGT